MNTTLLYSNEHTSCFNYEEESRLPLQVFQKGDGEQFEGDIIETVFVFFISGKCRLSYGEYLNIYVSGGKIILFPPGTHYKISVEESAHIAMLKVKGVIQLCECMSIEKLFSENSRPAKIGERVSLSKDPGILDINEHVYLFITDLCKHFGNGLRCLYYIQTKTKELFFLLRAYYDKESLAQFFAPLTSPNARFTLFVYNNYRRAKNLQELIDLSSYSESAFKKNFQKLFGVPASVWLRKQKAVHIFYDLNNPHLSLKEISNKYHFSSVSSFSTFCIQNFGNPPGKVRVLAKNTATPDR